MTSHFAGKVHTVSVVAVFAVMVTVLATLAALAQKSDTIQPSAAWPGASVHHSRTKAFSHAGSSNTAGFELPVTYATGGDTSVSVAIADLNGDGRPDIVVASWYENPKTNEGVVTVLLANSDGTFAAPVSYGTAGAQSLSVAVADLNGDGRPDLVVANSCLSMATCETGGGVSVLLGNGNGTFQPAVIYYSGGSGANSVAIADVNGDGRPDLVVGNGCQGLGSGCSAPGTAGILLGNGDGTFQPALSYNAGDQFISAIAVADLNGDGHPDVVVIGDNAPGLVSVLLGNGDGTFQEQVNYSMGGDEPGGVAIADVNGDGHPDLIVASECQDGDCNDGIVTVLLGNGDGTFQSPVIYSSGGIGAGSVTIADVNGDGHSDLVATDSASGGSGEIGVLLGNGDGTFQPAVSFPSGGLGPVSVAAADLNRDGKPDLVVVNESSTSVGVLLNNSGAAATTIALISSANPSVYGQAVTLTATVSATSGTPTGQVSFYDGSTLLGSATLASGSAGLAVSSLVVGSHSILAVYPGSSGFAPSSSSTVTQIVSPATTATGLASSVNPVGVGQNVTYTATVSGQYGGVTTGTVTFNDRARTIATVAVNGNQAAYTTFYEAEGTHLIVATYSGDANNNGSVSSVLTEKVGSGAKSYPSETTLVTSGSPSFAGQTVIFTATVTSAHGAIPDGETVTFYDGNGDSRTEIGTGTTASGVATFTTAALTAEAHTITANYVGDATFKPSRGKVKQVVKKYTTTTTLVSSMNPSQHNEPVYFTVTVTSAGGPTPTGEVFVTGYVGTATLIGGKATLQMPDYSPGKRHFTAFYRGDAFNETSKSQVLIQVIYPQ